MRYAKLVRYVYAYDEQTGFTLRFEEGKWEVSPVGYKILEHDELENFEYLTEDSALAETGGVTPDEAVARIKRILRIDEKKDGV